MTNGQPMVRRVATLGGLSVALYGGTFALQHLIAFAPLSVWPVALYLIATATTVLVYLRVLALAAGDTFPAAARRLAVAVPIATMLLLTFGRPALSIDVYSYLAHGYQRFVGENPYRQPLSGMQHTPHGEQLTGRGWIPVHGVSPYGPLWTWIETAAGRVPGSVDAQARAIKLAVTAFALLSALLIWRILGLVAPRDQLLGTLAYLWNPVIVMELAGEGHNDSLIVAAALAALLLGVKGRPAAGAVALGLGALVKVTALVVAPPQAVYWWRRSQSGGRLALQLTAAAGAVGAIAAVLYAPLWIGAATFDGLLVHGRPSVLASTPGVLIWYLSRWRPEEMLAAALSAAGSITLLGYAAFTSLKAVDPPAMFRACSRIAILYLLVAPGYWPWYAVLPLSLIALTPRGLLFRAMIAFTIASRLAAPVDRLRLNGLMSWPDEVVVNTVVGLWAPAAVVLGFAIWERRRATAESVGISSRAEVARGAGRA